VHFGKVAVTIGKTAAHQKWQHLVNATLAGSSNCFRRH
jgi:hypothetical protein